MYLFIYLLDFSYFQTCTTCTILKLIDNNNYYIDTAVLITCNALFYMIPWVILLEINN